MNEKMVAREIKTLKKQRDEARELLITLEGQHKALQTSFDAEISKLAVRLTAEINDLKTKLQLATEAGRQSANINETFALTITELKGQCVKLLEEKKALEEQVVALKAQDVKTLQRRLAAKAEENRQLLVQLEATNRALSEVKQSAKLHEALARQNVLVPT